MPAPLWVLVHSPLVGPLTWSLVANELQRRGAEAAVPEFRDADEDPAEAPLWRRHVDALVAALRGVPHDRPLILVGHSGAGPELPALGHGCEHPVAAYLFVDAGLPRNDASRLDLLRSEAPEFAEQLQRELAMGGRFPAWRDEDLREVLPDARLRGTMLAELQPRGLAFWEEPLPVPSAWPDAPCGYLRFTAGYAVPAERARREGWAYREIDAGHFHMLVDPPAVTDTVIGMVEELRIAWRSAS